jgi:hypothetical protein
MKNTAGDCQAAGGAKLPKSVNRQHNSIKKETEVSLKLTIMLLMKKYKQLIEWVGGVAAAFPSKNRTCEFPGIRLK